jgi:hypothetical protein
MTSATLKAPERPCRGCEAMIPAQASGPGRPREFHSRDCRRSYYHRVEQAAVERERAEAEERRRYESDVRYYGKRAAKRMAREREESRLYWARRED